MTRGVKITFLVAAALGLGVGSYWGYSEADEVSASLDSTQYFVPTKIAADFARLQFAHSDTDHARQAVMLQIRLLEQLEMADKDYHAKDLVFAYTRLAMIEAAAGQADAEKSALAQARTHYARASTRDEEMTDDQLESIVKRLDHAAESL